MIQSHGNGTGRRYFLKSGLRAFFLGFIALLSGALAMRNRRLSDEATACALRSPCRVCPKIANCTDPKARESKRKAVTLEKDSEQ